MTTAAKFCIALALVVLAVTVPVIKRWYTEQERLSYARWARECAIKLQHARTPSDTMRIIEGTSLVLGCAQPLAADTMPRGVAR